MITVTADVIDRCVGFIAGFKADKALRFYDVRGAGFPHCLLEGNEKERSVMDLINSGLSCKATAEKLGLSKGTVGAHVARFKSRIAFYYEYVSFYSFISPLLDLRLADVLGAIDRRFVESCENQGVTTIGELIDVYTHNNLATAGSMTAVLRLDRKRRIFDAVSDRCLALLDSKGFVVYFVSRQISLFNDNDYGYWTGASILVDSVLRPVCDDLITDRTKVFSEEADAKAAAQNMEKMYSFALSYDIVAEKLTPTTKPKPQRHMYRRT